MRRVLPLLTALVLTALGGVLAVPAAARAGGGTFTDLGAATTALTITQGVYGVDATGRDVAYGVVATNNAKLDVVDPRTHTLLAAVPLPGAAGSWAITVASDGRVYVGSYPNAHLYRYDPATGAVTDLGQPVAGQTFLYGLSAGPDGRVYGGSYPGTHAFGYDPGTGSFTDYGQLDTVDQYVRATAYDPVSGALYAGLATPHARLFRIDPATGARTELTSPSLSAATQVYDLDYADGRLFARLDSSLAVFDAATGQQLGLSTPAGPADTVPLSSRGVSAADGDSVYFSGPGNVLTRIDLSTATPTVSPVQVNGANAVLTGGQAIGYGWLTDGGHPVLYGLSGNYRGKAFAYDPTAGTLSNYSLPFRYEPVDLAHLYGGQDGKVYVSAFLNGTLAVYDPATGTFTSPGRLGQVEGWAWHDGRLIAGIYPYGRLLSYDPTAPIDTTNPATMFSLVDDYEQNRPTAVLATGPALYVGTTPGYGVYGGALTVYDFATGAYTVHRNVVTDQTVASLALVGTTLYGGTSVDGGQGTVPKATEAKVFAWDVATGTKTRELTPVRGARSVNALVPGPDGLLWGLADGTVFALDPRTGHVRQRTRVFDGDTAATDGELLFRGHTLYGVSGGRFFAVDPRSCRATVLRAAGVKRLTTDTVGALYFLSGDGGNDVHDHVVRYTP